VFCVGYLEHAAPLDRLWLRERWRRHKSKRGRDR
jgi:hypothetical protein